MFGALTSSLITSVFIALPVVVGGAIILDVGYHAFMFVADLYVANRNGSIRVIK